METAILFTLIVLTAAASILAFKWLLKNQHQHTLLKRLLFWLIDDGYRYNLVVAVVGMVLALLPTYMLIIYWFVEKPVDIPLWLFLSFSPIIFFYWFAFTSLVARFMRRLAKVLVMINPMQDLYSMGKALIIIAGWVGIHLFLAFLSLLSTIGVIEQIASSLR